MDTNAGIYLIVGILTVVLIIGAMKSRAEWIINFLNIFLGDVVPGMGIGYNPITFLTTGILGFPGLVVLYGINFYMLL